jgi:hypothetical protein
MNPAILWRPGWKLPYFNIFQNMAISKKRIPQNSVDFDTFFFQKNPLYESQWIFLCPQDEKICPSKKHLIKFFLKNWLRV